MRHLVHATQTLVEEVLKDYADVVSDNSQLALRLAYLHLSLDALIAESERALDLMDDLLTHKTEDVTCEAVEQFNTHVSKLGSAFADCYQSFKSLRSILWDAHPLLFQELMVALNAKAFYYTLGEDEDLYYQSPGYGIDDRAKYEINFLKAMLLIEYDDMKGKYLIGPGIRREIEKARGEIQKDELFSTGFPMSLDIHKAILPKKRGLDLPPRRRLKFRDKDLILNVTDTNLPAELGSEAAIAFLTERRVVVQSLIKVKNSLRNYLASLPTFTTNSMKGGTIDSHRISKIVQTALSRSIGVHVRCDINLYIHSNTTIELSSAVFAETSIYHSVRPLFGRDFNLEANLKRWYPEHLTYESAVQLGRLLFDGIFVDEIRDKYQLAKEISKSRDVSLTLSLKALEANRDIPRSFTAPWELLHDDEGFICLQYPFFRLPRGGKVYPISKVVPEITDALLIAANPGGGTSDIPEVEEEIEYIANVLKEMNIKPTCISSNDAEPKAILQELERGRFQVLHFAGHGHFDPDQPENSCLLIGTKGTGPFRLSARTLCEYTRNSNLSMVFLGSCFSAQHGINQYLRPWEILGLLDAFVQSGVPTAIGMQWSVSSQGALLLAKHFYESLKKRLTVEESLRRARRHLGALSNWEDLTWLAPVLVKFPL